MVNEYLLEFLVDCQASRSYREGIDLTLSLSQLQLLSTASAGTKAALT